MDEIAEGVYADATKFNSIYVKLFDKLANSISSKDGDEEKKCLGYALLTKLLTRCDEEMMRNVSQRIQTRIVDSTKQPISMGMLSFLRVVLMRHPSVSSYNQKSFELISSNILDFTFDQLLAYDEYTEDILFAIDVYARLVKMKQEKFILETIISLVANRLALDDAASLLQIKSLKYALSHRNDLIGFLWTIYDATLMQADPGTSVNLATFLEAMEKTLALKEEGISEFSLIPLRTIANLSRSTLLMAARRILTILATYELCERLLFGILLVLNDTFSSASIIYKKFPNVITRLTQALETNEDFTDSLVNLVISMLKTSALFIKPAIIIRLQNAVCRRALAWTPAINDLKLFNALLELNIETIPSPVQLGQSIFWRNFNTSNELFSYEVNRGRMLCASIVRPRSHKYFALVEEAEIPSTSQDYTTTRTSKETVNDQKTSTIFPALEKNPLSINEVIEEKRKVSATILINQQAPSSPSSSDASIEVISDGDEIIIEEPPSKLAKKTETRKLIQEGHSNRPIPSTPRDTSNNSRKNVPRDEENNMTIEEMLEDFIPV